jgi:hypothetical protein
MTKLEFYAQRCETLEGALKEAAATIATIKRGHLQPDNGRTSIGMGGESVTAEKCCDMTLEIITKALE